MRCRGMVLTGEGVEAQSCHTAWPACESGWSFRPHLALAGLMGPLPWASCLLPAQLPSASTLEPCGPDSYGGSLWSCPLEHDCTRQGLADTAPWQGSWTDTPYAALGSGGSGWEVPFALAGLSLTPPHPSLPLPQPHPWPWPWLVSQLWSQKPQAREGVIWLPLVSERLILSVDCPFFVILLLFCSVVLCNILLHRLFYSRKLEEYLL